MNKYAPGPWMKQKTVVYTMTGGYEWIATTSRSIGGMPENQELEEANSRLVAAAPELLEALEEVMKWQGHINAPEEIRANALYAIARAKDGL